MRRREFLIEILTPLAVGLGVGTHAHSGEKRPIGNEFIEETGLTLSDALRTIFRFRRRPPLYKHYPGSQQITLPEPDLPTVDFFGALRARRSVRDYSRSPLELAKLSALLHAASGITGDLDGYPLRAAPSAGALYPIEIYLLAHNVDRMQPGLYHYSVERHALDLLAVGDYRNEATSGCLSQEMAGDAAVTFVLSAIFARVCWKYGERGYRYALIEAGHIGQNIYLAATCLQLGCVAIGAFLDKNMNATVGTDGVEEAVIYCLAVGKR